MSSRHSAVKARTFKPVRTRSARKSTDGPARPRRNYARWRAFSLSLVYLVFAAHIIHWKLTGKTLAPLELNEVMYTLELGIITAGFIFMCALVLGTLIFGRFFCSWACHIMVLQDLCAWLLRKVKIRRKPVRSRLLLLVPPLTALYMFVWPQIVRAWQSRALPTFHMATDRDGWASLVTNNFWRNLPGPAVIVLTFLVCGFLIIYLMGTRTFCTYVCPYGAVFALADRFSPGKIRLNKECQQCGTCTDVCTSGVRVHEEVGQHGMIVNPACLKDLDCVSACPHQALEYRFGRPALFRSSSSGGRFGSLGYDYSLKEELLIAVVFIAVLLSFRSLYSQIPFLLSLALGGVIGFLAVVTCRLFTANRVSLSTVKLKSEGRLLPAGRVFAVFAAALAAFVGHSAFVRYHEYAGLRQARAMYAGDDAVAADALANLTTADKWGLLRNPRVERGAMLAAERLGEFDLVETYALRLLERAPNDLEVATHLGRSFAERGRASDAERVYRQILTQADQLEDPPHDALVSVRAALGSMLAGRRDFAGAAEQLEAVTRLDPERAAAHVELGSVLAELGRFDEAITAIREGLRLDPDLPGANYNLGTLLGFTGRFEEAIPCYEKALKATPDDAAIHNNLGFALLRTGDVARARDHFERAVSLDPANADAHFNLGAIYAQQGRLDLAEQYAREAAKLDPKYARMFGAAAEAGDR